MSPGVRRFTQLRAWQVCVAYKKAVYAACEVGPLATNLEKRTQLEESVAGPPSHVAEGFGRFNPLDFARFCVIARSSLMESQNHLLDLVDKKYIDEATREGLDGLAQAALQEVTGLMEYLQSPEALRNARRARERRIVSRQKRRSEQLEGGSANLEPEPAPNCEPEHEPSTENQEE